MENIDNLLKNVSIDDTSSDQPILRGSTHQVYLSEIFSPTRFYFQLANACSNNKTKTWDARCEWNTLYTCIPPGNEIDETDLIIGNMICVQVFGQWERATVMSKVRPESNTVKVFFVDFGTVGNVDIKYCRKLMNEWKNYSRLAYRGCLAGIKPNDGKLLWDFSTIYKFIEAMKDEKVTMTILNYDHKNKIYEVKLSKGLRDMAEIMLNCGCAEETKSSYSLNYPPFEILETADFYPTLGEREYIFKKRGIDFNQFENENISASIKTVDSLKAEFKAKFQLDEFANIFKAFMFLMKGKC